MKDISYQLNIAICKAVASGRTREEVNALAYEMHQAVVWEQMAEEAAKNETKLLSFLEHFIVPTKRL
jgi:hypothetical protein